VERKGKTRNTNKKPNRKIGRDNKKIETQKRAKKKKLT
jgi:hypothetical protein